MDLAEARLRQTEANWAKKHADRFSPQKETTAPPARAKSKPMDPSNWAEIEAAIPPKPGTPSQLPAWEASTEVLRSHAGKQMASAQQAALEKLQAQTGTPLGEGWTRKV